MPRLLEPDVTHWPRPTLEEMRTTCELAYTSSPGGWIGQRDAAIIATVCMFGKRSVEVAMMKASDVWVSGDRIYARFHVKKTHQVRQAICPACGEKNRVKWKFCKGCGASTEKAKEVVSQKKDEPVVKSRPISHPLCAFLNDWHLRLLTFWKAKKKAITPESVWLFPPSSLAGIFGVSKIPELTKHVGRRSVYKSMRKWAPTWWPHLLRHSLATGLAEVGRSEFDLMDWFDWTRYETARRYVKMGGGRRIMEMGDEKI